MKVGENKDFVDTRKLYNHCTDLVTQLHTSYTKGSRTKCNLAMAKKTPFNQDVFHGSCSPFILLQTKRNKVFKQVIEFVVTSCNLHHGHRC